jgi:hypothetical protein
MRQIIRSAVASALLLLAPAAVPAASAILTSPAALTAAQAQLDSARAAQADPFGLADAPAAAADAALAPGQTASDFNAWLARSPANRSAAEAFRADLASQGLDRVVPVWQLLRTSSSWRQCGAEPFEVAPSDKWIHIAVTLRFVRDKVVPALGRVEALSGYRDEGLNACSAGAPRSAHRLFYAIDLTPRNPAVDRAEMIHDICAAHAREGRAYNAGLGFYSGRRFHVDSNGFRKWGPDGRGATSPCVTGIV